MRFFLSIFNAFWISNILNDIWPFALSFDKYSSKFFMYTYAQKTYSSIHDNFFLKQCQVFFVYFLYIFLNKKIVNFSLNLCSNFHQKNQILRTNPDREYLDRQTKNRRSQKQPKNSREKSMCRKMHHIPPDALKSNLRRKKPGLK